jgi:hypothetical protein
MVPPLVTCGPSSAVMVPVLMTPWLSTLPAVPPFWKVYCPERKLLSEMPSAEPMNPVALICPVRPM